jgi:hypothetical protein
MIHLMFIHLQLQRAYNASVIALLHRFGRINVAEELNGPRVHRLENILTLDLNYFFWFHELAIWLERKPAVSSKANFCYDKY